MILHTRALTFLYVIVYSMFGTRLLGPVVLLCPFENDLAYACQGIRGSQGAGKVSGSEGEKMWDLLDSG